MGFVDMPRTAYIHTYILTYVHYVHTYVCMYAVCMYASVRNDYVHVNQTCTL